jgi:hypothetical protein
MAFQYAHHRPLTPITPVHSPHPSAGSSVRARTPGQLSLHEYRKMQVTPSPPAIPGQKTVRKKRGMSSLSRTERLPANSPNANFFSSFASLTTPPETPSLAPPMGFTSVSPIDMPTMSHAHQAPEAATTYPEFTHLLSFGAELQHSPPYSPPLPSLSSASRPLLSTSPYQPATPNSIAGWASPPSRSLKHPLLGSQRSLRRPWSQTAGQEHRYVDVQSDTHPRSTGIERLDSSQTATPAIQRRSQDHLRRPQKFESTQYSTLLGSPFPGALLQDPLLDTGQHRRPRTSQDVSSEQIASVPRLPGRPPRRELGIFETSETASEATKPRER